MGNTTFIKDRNCVELAGVIVTQPEYSHEVYKEKFYMCNMQIERQSGYMDSIPLMISERLFRIEEIVIGQKFKAYAQLRSFNKHDDGKNHLLLYAFVKELELLDDSQNGLQLNGIYLDGYICKESVYRKTPLGREIAELLVAVNRSYGKSDYIPCIVWGRNARRASWFHPGTHIKLEGRVQSRLYNKKISDTEFEKRTAYEVSVSKIEVLEDGKE